MSVKELFLPEDSRFDSVAGIDSHMKITAQDVVKSIFWVSAAVLIIAYLSKLI
ncbi:hypothetical protein [Spirochaeta isovalerica]|uniref:Uncharacterized protein n=1 Tax=Spirochaeta isovalerica TaxID=150 RepID=A0A841RCV8_9SPIO|nr:hypothetical protein [Spirochaeta isovalerica]MBB6481496.1 hypothetical protein [Spirochaeta isovalerica]